VNPPLAATQPLEADDKTIGLFTITTGVTCGQQQPIGRIDIPVFDNLSYFDRKSILTYLRHLSKLVKYVPIWNDEFGFNFHDYHLIHQLE
jgi:hypothetical protein